MNMEIKDRYTRAIKKLVFYERFNVNDLPNGFTVQEYKQEMARLRSIISEYLRENNGT